MTKPGTHRWFLSCKRGCAARGSAFMGVGECILGKAEQRVNTNFLVEISFAKSSKLDKSRTESHNPAHEN